MTSESTTTVYGYLSLPSYCRNMTLRCAFCAHIIARLLELNTNFPHTVLHPVCFSAQKVQRSYRGGGTENRRFFLKYWLQKVSVEIEVRPCICVCVCSSQNSFWDCYGSFDDQRLFPSKSRFSANFSIWLRFGEFWNPTNCDRFNADGSLMGRTNLDQSVW